MPGRSTLTTTSRVFAPLSATSGLQLGGVHLRDGRGGQRLLLEHREHLLGGAAVGLLDDARARSGRRRAARGPAASRARRRCPRAAGRGAWTAPGRTSRRSGPAPAAPRAAARRAARRGGAPPRSTGDSRNRKRSGRYRWVARTNSSSPCRTSTRWISISRARTRSFIEVLRRIFGGLLHEARPRIEPVEVFAQPLHASVEVLGLGARHQVAALVGEVFGHVAHAGGARRAGRNCRPCAPGAGPGGPAYRR